MEGFLGEVKMFAGTYPPRAWAFCDGSLLKISEYTALFSLLGTQFGGDGRSTFGLPDLRGRVPVGAGNGINLTPRRQGEKGGLERVLLTDKEMPEHTHYVSCDMKSGGRSLSADPLNNIPSKITQGEAYGSDLSGKTYMNEDMLTQVGANQSHENMQPWEAINYIICIQGLFPPRN